MSQRRNHLESARAAWNDLPTRLRHDLAELLHDPDEAATKSRLSEALLERLLGEDRFLRECRARAAAGARRRLDQVIAQAAATLFEPRASGAVPVAYAQQLLALTLPLVEGGVAGVQAPDLAEEGSVAPSEPDSPATPADLRTLLERAHAHEVLAPLARERALERLAGELFRLVGEELRVKARGILAGPDTPVEVSSWLPRPDPLLLSVDHVTLSCARYLAGLQAVERDRYGFDELRAGPGGRAKRVDQVTVKFDPEEQRQESITEIGREGSELKAKLFVALFALAAQAKARGETGGQLVRLRDLLEMMGFRLGRHTNSLYYWRYAADLTRYLLVDLPSRVVAMQVSFAGQPEPLVVFERLLNLSRPLTAQFLPLEVEPWQRLRESLGGPAEAAAVVIRETGLEGFEFAVSDELLEAHGIGRPMNAIEHVPIEFLSLKGPAFWLAWQVAFLRRWAKPPEGGAQGKPLLRVLDETGYLRTHTRGERVRYKDAVSSWWRDAGDLVSMGLLDEPGVRLYGRRGSTWRDISSEISRSLDPRGDRLTYARLQDVRVVFQIPRWRVAELEEARRRKRRRRPELAAD